MLAGELGNQRRETIELARWLGRDIRPQVVVLTNLLIGGCIPELKRTTGAPVVVMLQGDDLFIEHLPEPSRQRCLNKLRELVRQVDMFLVNTDFYGSKMAAMLEIPPGKMRKVPLGLEPFSTLGRKATTQEKTAPRIGYMARLAPEKGLHVLVDAFIHMHAQQLSPEAELHIAGWLGTQHEPYAQQQWSKLELAGLASKFTYHGSPDFERKVALLRSFDVLSVPTTYDEPKGLFVLEAFAAGVPVVLPNRGAFPEILADCGGGYLVDADDSRVLAECLANLLSDRASAKKLGQQGFAGLQSKRTIQQIAATFQSVLTELVG